MGLPLNSISALLRAIDGTDGSASDSNLLEERLATWKPLQLVVADTHGGAISAIPAVAPRDVLSSESLIAQSIKAMKKERWCAWQVGKSAGRICALAVRLSGPAGDMILGGLLEPGEGFSLPTSEESTALTLCGAMAWTVQHGQAMDAELRTRVRHLSDEHETLRMSHTEAITAAIEEREQRIRDQEEHMARLQAVMMMAAEGIVTFNESGLIQSFNEAAGYTFNYSPEEAVGHYITDLIPPPPGLEWDEYLGDYLMGRKTAVASRGHEVLGRRKDGNDFFLEVAVSRVSIAERDVYTGILRDITERKRADRELKRLHLQNEMILNSAGEGILGVDHQGHVIFANPAAARALGWTANELVGRSLHQTIHYARKDGRPYPEAECPVCRTLDKGATVPHAEEVFCRRDGTSFPVEFVRTPIHEGDETIGAVITFRDVSERRMLEAQLRQAQKLESIGQLAAGIAHEINTPTQYIGDNTRFMKDAFEDVNSLLAAYAQLLDSAEKHEIDDSLVQEIRSLVEDADVDYLMHEIPKAIQQSLEGLARVAKIVHSMKEFSHPGGEEKQAVDLNQAIESTATVSRNEWKYVADLETDFDPDLPLVTCLPGDFNQVMLNLIVNAAHAIHDAVEAGLREKGTITVSTRRDGDWVEIRVHDTGTGIPERIRPRLFDPFFTTKEVGRGTGQGLAIAHSVVTEKHNGTISFETTLGEGTTFAVRLPVSPSSSHPEPKHEEASSVR
ncbi:MAG: PAS domain S-box protein [Pirellulales bacterium]|nr:PAS domain S-box protein [Pirellulales bacterium]